jgi:hypothetical protein
VDRLILLTRRTFSLFSLPILLCCYDGNVSKASIKADNHTALLTSRAENLFNYASCNLPFSWRREVTGHTKHTLRFITCHSSLNVLYFLHVVGFLYGDIRKVVEIQHTEQVGGDSVYISQLPNQS